MEHRTIEVDGVTVLLVKWQDDEQQPSIRMMAKVSYLYAEINAGFATEADRDRCYENDKSEMFTAFVALAKEAIKD